jgi:anti-sigma factor RsiW
MKQHKPFEMWILQDRSLNADEEQELELHLATCETCRQLKLGWQTSRQELTAAVALSPAPGFSQRWKASLADRRARQQQKQVRRFLKYLIGINLLSLAGLVTAIILGTSPLDLFSGLLHSSVSVFLYAKQVESLALAIYHSVPLYVPVVFWILLSTGFCLTALAWGASMWRYLIKGVSAK